MAATILIADDDAVARRLVENMVQKCGYETLVVDSGDEVIHVLPDQTDKVARARQQRRQLAKIVGGSLAATILGFLVVYWSTDSPPGSQTDPEQKHRGLAAFLVPTDSEGFSSSSIHGKLGLRASDTAELSLDGVEVGDEALMGEVGDGFKVAMSALDSGRFSVASGCVGICQGCVDASVAYSKDREQFDRPIASFQLVQEMLAEMVVDTEAARGLVWRAGWLKDLGRPNTTETSIAKYYATEAAVRCANMAIQVHGGSGYVDDYPVERYLRDARVTTLYEGTSQIQKLIIGRAVTGVNAMT